MEEMILILDFGSQYTQLIARRIRELNVYCEIHPYNKIPHLNKQIRGVILSGSPFSVRDEQAPKPDLTEIRRSFPLLGVCYGAQLMAHEAGGEVAPSEIREYGRANLTFIEKNEKLINNLSLGSQVWMSHGDTILKMPKNFQIINSTEDVQVAGYRVAGGTYLWHTVSSRGLSFC
jgi:GMP synthase (glutamine-hydrolysing)